MYTCIDVNAYSYNRFALHCVTCHYVTLHYIAIRCVALYFTALHSITSPDITTLHYITSIAHCDSLYALHCIALRCIALHCVALHSIPFHSTDTYTVWNVMNLYWPQRYPKKLLGSCYPVAPLCPQHWRFGHAWVLRSRVPVELVRFGEKRSWRNYGNTTGWMDGWMDRR